MVKGNSNKLQYLCRVSDIPQGKSKTFTIGYDNDTKKIEIAMRSQIDVHMREDPLLELQLVD